MKAVLFCNQVFAHTMEKALQSEGIEVEEIKSPDQIPEIKPDILVVQFPLGEFSRGDIFVNLEKLWDQASPLTLIIKPPQERIRKRDLKENVVVIDDTSSPEEAVKNLLDALKVPDYLLSRGLEAYAERNYPLAYEYWMRLARDERARGTKVYEYLKIARKEFEGAGLDISALDRVLEERLDPFREGTRLYSEGKLNEALKFLRKIPKDHPEFVRAMAVIENIKEEMELEDVEEVLEEIEGETFSEEDAFVRVEDSPKIDLTPKEAFLLSLIDGETPVRDIEKVAPMGREEFVQSFKKLLKYGLIRRKE